MGYLTKDDLNLGDNFTDEPTPVSEWLWLLGVLVLVVTIFLR